MDRIRRLVWSFAVRGDPRTCDGLRCPSAECRLRVAQYLSGAQVAWISAASGGENASCGLNGQRYRVAHSPVGSTTTANHTIDSLIHLRAGPNPGGRSKELAESVTEGANPTVRQGVRLARVLSELHAQCPPREHIPLFRLLSVLAQTA